MKKVFVIVAIVLLSTLSYAAQDTYVYEAKNGNVTFNHQSHGELMGCSKCHIDKIVKLEFDKNEAHGAVCKGCHKLESGPVSCKGCHVK